MTSLGGCQDTHECPLVGRGPLRVPRYSTCETEPMFGALAARNILRGALETCTLKDALCADQVGDERRGYRRGLRDALKQCEANQNLAAAEAAIELLLEEEVWRS